MLAGTSGLQHVEQRLLANPQARVGDVRHAATALRFMHEFGAAVIPTVEITRATRQLLARPDLAAAAIVDLARWEDWESLLAVAALFDEKAYADAATSRAIVGYLSVCPRRRRGRGIGAIPAAGSAPRGGGRRSWFVDAGPSIVPTHRLWRLRGFSFRRFRQRL